MKNAFLTQNQTKHKYEVLRKFDNSIHVVINHVNNVFEFLQVVCFKPNRAMFNNMTRWNKTFSDTYEDFFDFALNQIDPVWSTEDLLMLHQLFTDWEFLQYPNATVSSLTSTGYWYSSPITYLTYTNPNDMRIFCINLSTFFCHNFVYFLSLFLVSFDYCFFRFSHFFLFFERGGGGWRSIRRPNCQGKRSYVWWKQVCH